jgi:hypothetical protein
VREILLKIIVDIDRAFNYLERMKQIYQISHTGETNIYSLLRNDKSIGKIEGSVHASLIVRLLNEDEARKGEEARRNLQTRVQEVLKPIYFPSFHVITQIATALAAMGYNTENVANYSFTTEQGRHNFPLGSGFYLSIQWYKMPSGNWEITGYIS